MNEEIIGQILYDSAEQKKGPGSQDRSIESQDNYKETH